MERHFLLSELHLFTCEVWIVCKHLLYASPCSRTVKSTPLLFSQGLTRQVHTSLFALLFHLSLPVNTNNMFSLPSWKIQVVSFSWRGVLATFVHIFISKIVWETFLFIAKTVLVLIVWKSVIYFFPVSHFLLCYFSKSLRKQFFESLSQSCFCCLGGHRKCSPFLRQYIT